jgi:hypothetical protein
MDVRLYTDVFSKTYGNKHNRFTISFSNNVNVLKIVRFQINAISVGGLNAVPAIPNVTYNIHVDE